MSRKKICLSPGFTSAEEIAGCEDLVLEILVRMRAKSLLRSKLVSKHWLSLISDPQFVRNHTRKNPNKTPSGLYFTDSLNASQSVESVSLNQTTTPFLKSFGGLMKITQSCNGLLLCRFKSPKDADLFCVFNPTTWSYKVLPPPEMTETESSVAGVSLVFDPSVSLHYKVICVRKVTGRYAYRTKCRIDIYSSEHHSWRIVFDAYESNWNVNYESGVYSNGAVYWVSEAYSSLRFDIESETFILYNMPKMPESDRRGSCRYFGQCGGYVHFIKICHPSAKKFCVLELHKDCTKWVIKYRVSVCRLVHAFPEVARKTQNRGFEETVYAFSVLHVLRGAKEEDSELVMTIPGKVISYNFVKKSVKALLDLPGGEIIEPLRFSCISSYQFVETLVRV